MKQNPLSLRDVVLSAIPGTRKQIHKKTGVSPTTIGHWLRVFREQKLIHVGCWKRSHLGSKQPIFVLGAGVDKEPPKTLTNEESQKRRKIRHPERIKEIQNNSYRRCKMRSKNCGWMAALVF